LTSEDVEMGGTVADMAAGVSPWVFPTVDEAGVVPEVRSAGVRDVALAAADSVAAAPGARAVASDLAAATDAVAVTGGATAAAEGATTANATADATADAKVTNQATAKADAKVTNQATAKADTKATAEAAGARLPATGLKGWLVVLGGALFLAGVALRGMAGVRRRQEGGSLGVRP
jgi:hypothetical protein